MAAHTLEVNHPILINGHHCDMSTLAERITERMHALGIDTNVELAARIGVTKATVGDWLKGRTKTISGERLLAAARALQCDPDWLQSGRVKKGTPTGVSDDTGRYHTEAGLTDMEADMLDKIRRLSIDDQARLRAIIDALDSAQDNDREAGL